jgi:hypothetical protein
MNPGSGQIDKKSNNKYEWEEQFRPHSDDNGSK